MVAGKRISSLGTSNLATDSEDKVCCSEMQRVRINDSIIITYDRFCGLAGRVPGYRHKGPGFDSRNYQIF
jgi:hypothetical protein